MRKNVASQVVGAQLVSKTDGSDVTSGTTNVYVTGNGGTQAAGSGTVTHEGNGFWSYVPTQAETNYNHVAFTFVNSSAISQTVQLYPVSYDPTDSAGLGLSRLDAAVSAVLTTALTEAYRSTNATGTAAQLLYEILQNITEFTISSTTKTVKKIDGSTTAKTYTLNDATNPTGITEAT